MKKWYQIGEAADILQIVQHTLRYLESALQLDIQRNARGDRLYSEEDMSTLQLILKLKNEKGLNTAAIRMALDNLTSEEVKEVSAPAPSGQPDIRFIARAAQTVQEQSDRLIRQTQKIDDRLHELERKLEEQEKLQTEKLDELLRLWKNETTSANTSWFSRWRKK
jgi:DNA-binding transcriptional MerR regulator